MSGKLKRLVEEPGKSHFCEVEKTRFKVSKVLQRVTCAFNVRFLQNFVHIISTGNAIQQSTLISQILYKSSKNDIL